MKNYEGDKFMAVFKFSELNAELSDLTLLLDSTVDGYISKLNFDFSDGNRQVDPLGLMCSSRLYMTCYDGQDNLNPLNENSPYTGYLRNGLHVNMYTGISEYDETEQTWVTTWNNYGDWYVVSWSNAYEGAPGFVNISLEDKLNKIGNMVLTQPDDASENDDDNSQSVNEQIAEAVQEAVSALVSALSDNEEDDEPVTWYTGTTVQEALKFIFEDKAGLTSSEYVLDVSNDIKNTYYPNINPGYARNTLNDICKLTLCSLSVAHDGKVYFRSLLATGTATETLTAADIGAVSANQTECTDIVRVAVDYPDKYALQYVKLAELNNGVIRKTSKGYTTFNIKLPNDTQSIEDVMVDVDAGDNTTVNISSIPYSGNETKLKVKVKLLPDLTADDKYNVDIQVYGTKTGDLVRKTAEKSLYEGDEPDGRTLIFTAASSFPYDEHTPDENAEIFAENLANYIKGLQKSISTTAGQLSPSFNVGDIIELANDEYVDGIPDYYEGLYVISQFSVEVGQTYNTKLVLYKLIEEV